MNGLNAFVGAFNERDITSSLYDQNKFDYYSARLMRYAMYSASYENTSYRDVHDWAQGVRNRYGLGKYIADVYNPTAQLVDFHSSTIWRGSLTPLLIGGAVPLIVSGKSDEQKVRQAADNLLRLSNFEVGKNIAAMKGSNLGDVGLRLIDDMERGQVRIEVIDPSEIEDVEVLSGIVKSYCLTRYDYDDKGRKVKYSETCERGDNDDVIYRTYIDDRPAAFPGAKYAEWVEAYGFIPFARICHRDVGRKWGWAELHPIYPKIRVMDDQATLLNDWVRRSTQSVGIISGISKPKNALSTTATAPTQDNPYPGREEERFLFSDNENVGYTPLTAPIDIAATDAHIQNIMASIESDMPELRKSIWDIQGDPSGVALATAREPVVEKINLRRVNYDAALVRVLQMGIAIGGMRGYKGFDGFDLQSYANGMLDISISPRPVFGEQREALMREKALFWQTAANVVGSGTADFVTVARDYGWDEDKLKDYETERQKGFIPPDGM